MKLSLARCALTLLGALLFADGGAAQAEEAKVRNVYNWPDYISEETIQKFEKETAIKVRYDVVVPGSNGAGLQILGGLLQELDKPKIPNLKNIDPSINERLSKVDPGNKFLVIWL
ncbi:hypothetical protein ACS5PK_04280 [Roseateles sp. DB2]|uniref:hypothetical protein n=1 Tax=Roseateles sp. DB2 TaxID=3453717 RepID=UPI003EED7FAD